jgi:fructose-1-phosphate kinase PfkB-like protein
MRLRLSTSSSYPKWSWLRCRAVSRQVILDTSGEALRLGLEAAPDVLKCNRTELSGAVGQPLETLDDLRCAIRALSQRLGTRVVITLGGSGAIAAVGQRTWLAQAPRVEAVSAVGSGDSFLAGLVCGLVEGRAFEDALRLAIAAGSANTLQIGAGRLLLSDVKALLDQVVVAEEK